MKKDQRDLLDVLKFELNFLEKGGYGRSPREPRRPRMIFEDSPTCMNYDSKEHPDPCEQCVLMELVPPAFRAADLPCRHIPFNAEGASLDSLYHSDDSETQEIFGTWLKATIVQLEIQRLTHQNGATGASAPGSGESIGEPLFQGPHPKCANPACPTTFHWLGGGKFFRFRPDSGPSHSEDQESRLPVGTRSVKHYWLCERCTHVFTLASDESDGVVLKLLRLERAVEASAKQSNLA